jgi:uncharacterized protein
MEEKIYFQNKDNLKLCGILSKSNRENKICILLCHGITVEKNEDGVFSDLSDELTKSGFDVFRFDFRGHGESQGNSIDMTISGEKRDIESAIQLLIKKGYKKFGILAASFGGGPVSFYCKENTSLIKAIIFWNSLIDYSSKINPVTERGKKDWGKDAFERVEKYGFTEIGRRKFKVGKNLIDEIKSLEPWKELKGLNIPMMFIHGDKDTHVPYEDSVKYSRMFNAKLITISGAEHGFHDSKNNSMKANRETVKFFLDNLK